MNSTNSENLAGTPSEDFLCILPKIGSEISPGIIIEISPQVPQDPHGFIEQKSHFSYKDFLTFFPKISRYLAWVLWISSEISTGIFSEILLQILPDIFRRIPSKACLRFLRKFLYGFL